MTPMKFIAGMIDREKHKAEQARKLKENYGRFRAKVKKEGQDVTPAQPVDASPKGL